MSPLPDKLLQKLPCIDADIRQSEPLDKHCTFGIGGRAFVYAAPADKAALIQILHLCEETGAPYMVIGRGSNILFPDRDLDMVIISTEKLGIIEQTDGGLRAGAGALLKNLAAQAQRAGFSGLEFACGIPGTLGGALRMNAGAYGGEMSQVLTSALVLERLDGAYTPRLLTNSEMEFGYRRSVVIKGGFIVLAGELALTRGDGVQIQAVMDDLMRKRNDKQPVTMPSAGSAFKRPFDGKDGVSAAGLIDECGLKGYAVGGAQVSPKHAGFIVNTGGATAADVRALIGHIRDVVRRETDILLEPEIIIVE